MLSKYNFVFAVMLIVLCDISGQNLLKFGKSFREVAIKSPLFKFGNIFQRITDKNSTNKTIINSITVPSASHRINMSVFHRLNPFPLLSFLSGMQMRLNKSQPSETESTNLTSLRDERQDFIYNGNNIYDSTALTPSNAEMSEAMNNIMYGVQKLVGISTVQLQDGVNRIQQVILFEKMTFIDWAVILALPLLIAVILFQKLNIGMDFILQGALVLMALFFVTLTTNTNQITQQQQLRLT
ncbi:hypothetical protein CHUAL_003634 [Chamberlinius hualienensis]